MGSARGLLVHANSVLCALHQDFAIASYVGLINICATQQALVATFRRKRCFTSITRTRPALALSSYFSWCHRYNIASHSAIPWGCVNVLRQAVRCNDDS